MGIIKSLEPYDKKIGTDTWYYAKRCFLALAENMAKHMLMLKDASIHEIISFLDAADQNGASVVTVIAPTVDPDGTHQVDRSTHNVSYESRQLKKAFLKLRECGVVLGGGRQLAERPARRWPVHLTGPRILLVSSLA